MKRLILTSICLLFANLTTTKNFGQVPGFMGNRFSIGYHLITGINFNEISENSQGSWFSMRHELNLDYVARRRTTIGLEFGHSSMKFLISNHGQYTLDKPYTTNVSENSFGMNVKFFRGNGPIAPVGSYFKIRGGIVSANMDYPSFHFGYANSTTEYHPGFQGHYNSKYIGIG